jgi:hypothetical protein
MISETLAAIGLSGRNALVQISPKFEVETKITQVREWSFAMPDLARVTVANSPIHQIYVGLSRPLASVLGQREGVFENLLENFKQALTTRVPAKRPIVAWSILDAAGDTQILRGVRSFILRQRTFAGNLYLMADVASRCEYETMRSAEWQAELAATHLPHDLARSDAIVDPTALERLATYLTRCEHDLELLVPGADGNVHACNGVLINHIKGGPRGRMLLSLDLGREMRAELKPGLRLEGSFGAAGRVFRFRTHCLGSEDLPLEGLASLPCYLFELPERYHLDQRRRYFRVEPGGELRAQLRVLPLEAAGDAGVEPVVAEVDRLVASSAEPVEARVEDLSFSGAGLAVDGPVPEGLVRDGLVNLRLEGDGLKQSTELTGLVRRLECQPMGRGRTRTKLGVEFVVRSPGDRQSTQLIRQYVMAQQRRLLSTRSIEEQPV